MFKSKDRHTIHTSDGYKQFFEEGSLFGLQKISSTLQLHKKQIMSLELTELELLIAHSKTIENRQKQTSIIGIMASVGFGMVGLLFSLIPKNDNNSLLALLLCIWILITLSLLMRSVQRYFKYVVYTSNFREIAEIVLEVKKSQSTNQNTSETSNT